MHDKHDFPQQHLVSWFVSNHGIKISTHSPVTKTKCCTQCLESAFLKRMRNNQTDVIFFTSNNYVAQSLPASLRSVQLADLYKYDQLSLLESTKELCTQVKLYDILNLAATYQDQQLATFSLKQCQPAIYLFGQTNVYQLQVQQRLLNIAQLDLPE